MTQTTTNQTLQIWGGVEPTINRVGDRYFRQFDRSGHPTRLSDLDEFASLGLRMLRFPILWEEIAPDSLDAFDWSPVDAALDRLQQLRIEPIAGLLHHGSGPHYTSLVDPLFPEKLAAFARAVAQRYPWIRAYTPVNEPLTTARFSGLYGHWYPHGHDEQTFVRCLVNQCRGVVLAMRAIREVNPAAALVQTDDVGKTFSTPKLAYQADFENERRWTTWDLLCGSLDESRRMWGHLKYAGVKTDELEWFRENPCPPGVIGVNHYITSERFLDENVEMHPAETHGGNGRHHYADVAAVRSRAEGIAGTEGVLREAWDRYRLPVAVTEAHIGCTREEQLRWFMEIWSGANRLRNEGVDVRAVTVWSLLGAFDWNSLLTRDDGFYEPGAYDLRGGTPRRTAIAKMVHALTTYRRFDHPILATAGWWRRSVRLLSASPTSAEGTADVQSECGPTTTTPTIQIGASRTRSRKSTDARPILITGAAGRLAQGFIRAAELRGLEYRAYSHAALDIADGNAIATAMEACRPWAVINCAGFSGVDAAESDEQTCIRSNTRGAATLATICAEERTPFVTFSSDHVFDGGKRHPYLESDAPCPLNVYGESKLLAERQVLAAFPEALIIRPGKVFAPFETSDFLRSHLRAIARGERVTVENDIQISVTYLPDLVHATLDLLVDGESGIWHLANTGALTPEQFLIAAADIVHLDAGQITGTAIWRLNHAALRPRYRALASERGQLLPPLDDALQRYCRETPGLRQPAGALLAS